MSVALRCAAAGDCNVRCFHPIKAWQLESGTIVFAERGNIKRSLQLPCNGCVGCRLNRARQWTVRCVHESQMHPVNSFVTLTYDEDHLPYGGSLVYRDFQLFCKRARHVLGPFRFYMCGEYGEQNWRPHFHACLFGVHFEDRKFFKMSPDGVSRTYTSAILDKLWSKGHCQLGDVTAQSAGYCARYVMGKVGGKMADDHYLRVLDTGEAFWLEPEFNHMSVRPGLGRTWWDKYKGDILSRDSVVLSGKVMKTPRFYDQLLAVCDPLLMDQFEFDRLLKVRLEDSTPERLATQEIVQKAAIKFLSRSL